MMVIAVGLSSYNVALFHLVNHAFYKALLFLGAGSVIHAWADNQDFRKYGGLRAFLPLTYSVMLIASLSLVAFPFMTGFYSKDFILESAYGQFYFSSTVVYFIATIGAMFTTLYSVKVLYLTFLTNPAGPRVNYKKAHESDIYMSLPLIVLAFFSIFFGYITKDIFIGLGSGFFTDNGLFIHPRHELILDTEFAVPALFKLLPLIFTILLSVFTIVLSEFLPKLLIQFKFSRFGYNIFSFFNQRFLIELFYNNYITDFILKLGGQTTKVIDKGSVELLGPSGLEKGLLNLSKKIASLDTGVITTYALYILVGLIFYILIPSLSLTDNSLIIIMLFGLISLTESKYNSPPKPHAFVSSSLQSGVKDMVTIFICGVMVTVPSSYITMIKNFGIGILLGIPVVTTITVYFVHTNPYIDLINELFRVIADINLHLNTLVNQLDLFENYLNRGVSHSMYPGLNGNIDYLIIQIESLLDRAHSIESAISELNANNPTRLELITERFNSLHDRFTLLFERYDSMLSR